MQQLTEKKARPPVARALRRLLCVAALSQPNLSYAAGGGGGFTAAVAPTAGGFGGFRGDGFGGFRAGALAVDGIVASRAFTLASAADMGAAGTTAGTAVATAGGGATGWEGLSLCLWLGLLSRLRLLPRRLRLHPA
jgi:hypothetical protein